MTIRMILTFTLCVLSSCPIILSATDTTPTDTTNIVYPVKKEPLRKRRARAIKAHKEEYQNSHKTMSSMNFDELEVLKQRLAVEKNYESAIKAIEKQEKLCKDLDVMAILMLEKADIHLKQENYKVAGELYRSFIELYPGNPDVEKAHGLAIKCFKERTLDAERDQSNTLIVIELCDQYMEHKDIYTNIDEIKKVRDECYTLLAQSEINVFKFYIHRGKFLSAQTRLDSIKRDYLKELPNLEPLLLTCDIDLAQAQNNTERLKEKQLELEQKYPTIHAVTLVENKPTKKHADRF